MDKEIRLTRKDTDITLIMPGGQRIVLQWRMEGPSLDICLPAECPTHCWEGDDLQPAPIIDATRPHVRDTKQLCINVPLVWINE